MSTKWVINYITFNNNYDGIEVDIYSFSEDTKIVSVINYILENSRKFGIESVTECFEVDE